MAELLTGSGAPHSGRRKYSQSRSCGQTGDELGGAGRVRAGAGRVGAEPAPIRTSPILSQFSFRTSRTDPLRTVKNADP